MHATAERKVASHTITALDRDRRGFAGPPCQRTARIVAPDQRRNVRAGDGRRHRATVLLTEAPRRARVVTRHRFDRLHERGRRNLESVERLRQKHPKKLRFVERVDEARGKMPFLLRIVSAFFDKRT